MAPSLGLSVGFKFEPTDEMLLQFFLLPYLRDGRPPLAGLVLLDDPRALPPWMLLQRHGRGEEDGAYFIAPAAGEGRQVRSVAGGGRWVKQRTDAKGAVRLAGETFRWERFSLNFHCDDRRSGSTGWVMHEYVVFPPPGSAIATSHRACYISFTGHGQNRKRIPDGYGLEASQSTSSSLAADVEASQSQSTSSSLAAAPEQQSNQEYAYGEQNQCSIVPQQQSNQEYAYGEQNQCCIVPQQQSNQDFAGVNDGGATVSPEEEDGQSLDDMEMDGMISALMKTLDAPEDEPPGFLPEQQSNQDFAFYEQQQQQFFLSDQLVDEVLAGVNDGGATISPEEEDGQFLDDMEMDGMVSEWFETAAGSEEGSLAGAATLPSFVQDEPPCFLPEL
uniref:NAC domain-containing protein n=1 Tax=Oryza brachyantha TaxID=4533 RepID=J3LBU1_ORYBR